MFFSDNMEYCFLKGFLAILLIQHCTSEGLPTSTLSLTVTPEDVQALPQEPELPSAEIVPVVAPPSLKEVQQAMQEASEQVEGRGAEEVLKELLERVVEATLGQVEGGSEGKADEATVQEGIEEEALRDGKGEIKVNTVEDVLNQAVADEVEGGDTAANGGLAGVEEEQALAEMDAPEVAVAEEVTGVKELEGETAAGSVEEVAAGVETGSRETVGPEVIGASLETEISQDVVEGTVAAVGVGLAVDETVVEANNQHAVLSEVKGETEAETQEAEGTPAVVEVTIGEGPEQETVSDPSLGVGDIGQIEDVWGMGDALKEETQVEEAEGELVTLPSDNYDIETTQSMVGEPVQEEEMNIPKDVEGQKVEDEQGHLVVEGGPTEEAVGAETVEAAGGDKDEDIVITEESEVPVNEGGAQQSEEEEQITLETTHGSEKDEEDHDVMVISAPEPEGGAEASIEQSPENQAPTQSPSLGGVETGENHINEISTPTDEVSPHDSAVAEPTLDNFVKDAVAVPPQAEGEANELVEDTAETTETKELGLEAWKIGAITAAVFLVLETLVIIIYILKCRKENSTQALQRACEEGCVEPEGATGGDCSDDTLPAGNEDTQQISSDPSDVASTLAQNKEQQEEEQHVIAMSDLPTSSPEELPSSGPGPVSSQDLRTSIL